MSNRRGRWQGNDEKKKEEIGPCYHCKKSRHLIADFPALNTKATTSKRILKKKAIKATWDDIESDSEEEIVVANVCFMAHRDNSNKITSELNLDDSELSMDELAMAFEELQSKYDLLRVNNTKLRKEK